MENGELYLDLKGPAGRVAGEVKAQGFVDQIDVVDWSWGADLSAESAEAGSGAGSNRLEIGVLTLKKRVDRSSTALMNGAARLTKFPKAVLTLLHRAEYAMQLTVELTDVRIEKYELSVRDDEKSGVVMDETLQLRAEAMRIEYSPRPAPGTKASKTLSVEMRAGGKP